MPRTFTISGSDGLTIACYRWDPARTAKGVVQVTHGLGEHALRYEHFAHACTNRGFVVYAQDHRGHGATAPTPEDQGQLGAEGWLALVADIGALSAEIRKSHPDIPLAIVAHSLGSFATQQYLIEHSAAADAVAMTGTAALDLLGPALNLDGPVGLEMFNAPFQPARTEFDWLSRDNAQVDAYIADPLCGFGLDIEGMKAMFAGAAKAAEPEAVARIRKDLPLYLAVGDADPVNGNLALFNPLVERYLSAGITDLRTRVYPGARHEILNETNRATVESELLEWLELKI